MKPFPLSPYIVAFAFMPMQGFCVYNDYSDAYSKWELAAHADNPSSSFVSKHFTELQRTWLSAPEQQRVLKAGTYADAAVKTAELLSNNGKIEESATLLAEAGGIAKSYNFDLGRGRSPTHFYQVASVQARVITETKRDPLIGMPLGYELESEADGYFAIQQSPGSERTISSASPFPIEVLAANESAGTILCIDNRGSIVEALPVVIAEGSGSLRSRLTAVLRHEPAGPSGPGRFVKQEPEVFFAEQRSITATPTLAPPSPRPQPPTQQVKTPESKPQYAPPSGEPASSTPWSIIVVLIIAATGLLWLLAKKRK
jgi:hypothetical protein